MLYVGYCMCLWHEQKEKKKSPNKKFKTKSTPDRHNQNYYGNVLIRTEMKMVKTIQEKMNTGGKTKVNHTDELGHFSCSLQLYKNKVP